VLFNIELVLDSGPEQRPFDIANAIEDQNAVLEVNGTIYIVNQVRARSEKSADVLNFPSIHLCPSCRGDGLDLQGNECWECDGEGKIRAHAADA
jgi:RecJ-like exonuclease